MIHLKNTKMREKNERESGDYNSRGRLKIAPINKNQIKEYLEYDETSPSCLKWIKTTNRRIIVGSNAGVKVNSGYYKVKLIGVQYLAHRLVWTLFNDDPGLLLVDHKNRDKTDNKIENLRLVTHSQNVMNAEYTPKTSRYRGVYHSPNGRFRARLKHEVAWFDNEVDAVVWWNQRAREMFGDSALLNQI